MTISSTNKGLINEYLTNPIKYFYMCIFIGILNIKTHKTENIARSFVIESNYNAVYPEPQQEKRSFAMLAHWGALSNIGKNRSPIREVARYRPIKEIDGITAETRARANGQPLRWG